jgi:high-affinity iron transporter
MGVLLLLIVAGLVLTALQSFDSAVGSLAQIDRQSQFLCFYYERFTKDPSCILGPKFGIPPRYYLMTCSLALFSKLCLAIEKTLSCSSSGLCCVLLTVGGLYFRSLGGRAIRSAKASQLPKQ